MNNRTQIIIIVLGALAALAVLVACFFFFVLGARLGGQETGPEPTPTMTQLPQPVINHPVEGIVGQPVTFDGSETQPGANPIASYEWDFGDGNTGEGATVEYIYTKPGTYDVTLTVTDTEGFGNVGGPVQITITEAPPGPTPTPTQLPQPIINYPAEARVGEQVPFDGSQSQPGSFSIASYDWDFGDSTTARGPVVTHVYNNPGIYQVTLTVTDEQGFGNTVSVQINIKAAEPEPGAPPQAVVNYPTEVRVGDQATFDGSQSIPGGSPIVGYDWEFGDGDTASGSKVTHVYDNPGRYRVTLKVTAQDGQNNRSSVDINVVQINVPEPTSTPVPEPEGPQAVINAPTEGNVGEPVTFDGSQSVQGTNPIKSYEWDFGDGQSGSGAAVEHTYEAPGVYNVTLTVTDTAGLDNVGGPLQITINELEAVPLPE